MTRWQHSYDRPCSHRRPRRGRSYRVPPLGPRSRELIRNATKLSERVCSGSGADSCGASMSNFSETCHDFKNGGACRRLVPVVELYGA